MADFPSRAELDRVVDLLREDLRNATQDLKKDVKLGFDGVYERLDALGVESADHAGRLATLEAVRGRVSLETLVSFLSLGLAGLAAWWSGKP